MRIIERVNNLTKHIVYVVQEENNNVGAYNQINAFMSTRTPKFSDVRSFNTLQEARDYLYQYTNNLAPGERVVT